MKKLPGIIILVLLVAGVLFWASNQQSKTMANQVSVPAGVNPHVILSTTEGDIEVELLADKAPKTVENFVKLTNNGFYNGTLFHRVIPNFMIQGGDPLTREQPKNWRVHGTGGPGYKFADEPNDVKLVSGVLAMANAGPNTNGSQFFIITAPATDWLEGKHTAFGRVVKGMEVVEKVEQAKRDGNDHPLTDIKINTATVVVPVK